MIQHYAPISGIAAFKDDYVATAGYDNRVILWDAQKKQAKACGFHDHLANQCQFSPCGRYLMSSSSDYSARLWSVPDMRLLAVFTDHTDDVEGVAFHPTQSLIATVSRDSHLRIFNYQGQLLAKLSGYTRDALSVAWLNENELITSSDDGTIKRWHATQKRCTKDKDMGGVETDTIALTSDGVIFAGNDEGNIIVIHGDQQTIVKAHKAGIKRLCYSQAQQKLVSLSYDRSFCIWSVENDIELKLIKRAQYPNVVWARACDFLGRSKLVFVSFGSTYITYDYKKDLWDLAQVNETHGINAVTVHNEAVYTVGDAGIVKCNNKIIVQLPSLCNFLTTVGNRLVTGGQTGELFDACTGKVLYAHHSPLNCGVAFRKGYQDYCVIGNYTGEGIVLKLINHQCELDHIIALHDNAIKSLAANNQVLFSVCATGAAAFHDLKDYHCIKYIDNAHDKIANGCACVKNDQFVSVSRDLKLRIFSAGKIDIVDTPHNHSIKCVSASTDGRFIATGGYHGHIHIYDYIAKQWLSKRPTVAGISSLCFFSEKNQFLASSYDGKIYEIMLEGI